jgi:hypothetical protein
MGISRVRPNEQESDRPVYQIKVQGVLDERWSDWFDGMAITPEGGVTTMTGPVVDQAALHGILSKIRDLNLRLISVTQMGVEEQEAQHGTERERQQR